MIHGGGDLDDALGAPVGRLQRDDHVLGGAEGREADERQPWWAVEEDEVVLAPYIVQGIRQRQVQIGFFPDSLIRKVVGRQHGTGRDQIDVGETGLADHRGRIRIGARIEQGLDARQGIAIGQQALGDIALRVGIDDQHPPGAFLTHAGQQPRGVGLAHPALEIDHRDRLRTTLPDAEHGRECSSLKLTASTSWRL